MARPEASEMCRLRKDDRLFTTRVVWKVTSRHTVWLTRTRRVQCVRVSSNYNACGGTKSPAVILYLSEAEYARLFVPIREKKR